MIDHHAPLWNIEPSNDPAKEEALREAALTLAWTRLQGGTGPNYESFYTGGLDADTVHENHIRTALRYLMIGSHARRIPTQVHPG